MFSPANRQFPHDVLTPATLAAWFKREPVWVTPLALLLAITLTRSVSEGPGYPRLRFGLVCRECHPVLNHATLAVSLRRD